jgi:hypothetical protein
MKLRFLFPYQFKRIGLYLFIVGIIGWLWGQFDGSAQLIKRVIKPKGKLVTYHPLAQNQSDINVMFLLLMFFGFVVGLFLLILSREKKEDEYSQKVRLESYQFAAIFQFILIFVLLIVRFITGSDIMETLIVELGLVFILLFWIVYIIRFNWILHFSKSPDEKIKA